MERIVPFFYFLTWNIIKNIKYKIFISDLIKKELKNFHLKNPRNVLEMARSGQVARKAFL